VSSETNETSKPGVSCRSRWTDLIFANIQDDTLLVLSNDGAGVFSTTERYGSSDEPYFIVAADLNRDGRNELVVTSDDFSVLTSFCRR